MRRLVTLNTRLPWFEKELVFERSTVGVCDSGAAQQIDIGVCDVYIGAIIILQRLAWMYVSFANDR